MAPGDIQEQPSTRDIALELARFSLPLILSGILQQLYNWTDAFIIGNAEGDLPLAAIGATTTVVNFYLNAITGFTLGLSVLFAQKFGAGRHDEAPRLMTSFSLLLGGTFLVLASCGIVFSAPLLEALDTTPDTFDLACTYLRIVLVGVPFLAVYNVCCAGLRGQGDSKTPFYSVLFSFLANVVLDVWFVLCLHLSVAGVALATVLSQVGMTVWLVAHGLRRHPDLFRRTSGPLMDWGLLKEGCRFGLPPMIQQSISSVGALLIQRLMNSFGTQTVTAITTAYRVDSIVMLPVVNLGSGISTLVGQRAGAKNEEGARRTFSVGSAMMACVSAALVLLVIPNGGRFVALFGAGEEAIRIGEAFFRRLGGFYLVYGMAMAVRGYIEGVGDLAYSSMAGIGCLIARIAFSYLLAVWLGNMSIALGEGLSWVVLLVLYLVRLWKKLRGRKCHHR